MEKRTLNVYLIYLSVCLFVCCIRLSVCAFVVLGWVYQSWEGAGPNCTLPPPLPFTRRGGAETTHTHSSPLCFISTLLIHIFLFLLSLVFVRKPEKRDKNFKLVFKSTIRKKATKNMASLWVHRKVIVKFFYGLALLALHAFFLCCEKFLRICFK